MQAKSTRLDLQAGLEKILYIFFPVIYKFFLRKRFSSKNKASRAIAALLIPDPIISFIQNA